MKKILLIIDNLGSGGAQNQITLLACGLKERGHTVSVIYYFPQNFFKERLEKEGIETIFVHKKEKFGLNIIFNVVRLIRKYRYDAIISFLPTPNFYSIIAKIISGRKQIHIISYRSKTDIDKLGYFELILKNWINKLADFIVFNSYHERNNWAKYSLIIKNKSFTTYNAINPDEYFYIKKLDWSKKLICVGSIGPDKNGCCVIEALNDYNSKNKDKVSITWVGQKVEHIPERNDYFIKMSKKIEQYKLHDYWHWKDPVKNLAPIYHDHDALILASTTEGLPNVVCEAMACGLPIIISNVLDHSVLVDDGRNGILFNPENPLDLSLSIENFYNNGFENYTQKCLDASKYAKSMFLKDKFIDAFESLIV